MPERIYGREAELATLIKSVEGIALGRAQLLLITGRSGVGKSSLVREVMRPVAGRRGHLISGKFDQLNRGTPYRAIGQAFEELVRKLLGEPVARVNAWRRTLLEAMGQNAQVVIDVIPSLEWLVGETPKVPTLGAAEAQTRFNIVFRRLLRALAGPGPSARDFSRRSPMGRRRFARPDRGVDVGSRSRRPADDRRLPG